jgi:hypothetical protein
VGHGRSRTSIWVAAALVAAGLLVAQPARASANWFAHIPIFRIRSRTASPAAGQENAA